MLDVKRLVETNKRVSAAVLEIMEKWMSTYKEKNANYGSSWLLTGQTLSLWFPDGVTLDTPRKFVMFGLTVRMLDKIIRASNIELTAEKDKVGERTFDTFSDLGVYGFMSAAATSLEEDK